MPQGRDNSQRNHQAPHSRWVLVGVCGAGMQSFARILESELADESLIEIVGTDVDLDRLQQLPQSIRRTMTRDWNADWTEVFTTGTQVVHSVAVPCESMILEQARRGGCVVMPLPEALGRIADKRNQVCIAGTHGKTTTSGLVSWILQQTEREAFHFVGGEFCLNAALSHRQAARSMQANWAVMESCEYRNSFLSLRPKVAVVTGIEPDHFDFFTSMDEQVRSFETFLNRSHSEGTIVVNADCPTSMMLAKQSGRSFITYSSTSIDADWSVRPVDNHHSVKPGRRTRQQVMLMHRGEFMMECDIPLPGEHNCQNWLAGVIGAMTCGVSLATAVDVASTFPGMRRRFEYRGNWNETHWIDDYAHHPTAIRETLKTARIVFPSARVIAVVEPHQISRTEHLFSEYANCLTSADEVMLLPVLPARENAGLAGCLRLSGRLVRKISESGGRAMLAANLDQVLGRLDHSVRPGDVVITMGAGRTNTIHDEIHRRLQRNSAA